MSQPILRISEEAIQRQMDQIAQRISSDYQGREVVVVGVLKGAFIFMADLIRKLTIPLTIDFVQVASYGTSTVSSGDISMKLPIGTDVAGKHVLLVEDIVDTGITIRYLIDYLKALGAASVAVCALIDKSERRETPVPIDYACLNVSKGFLVGYGLDHAERYRNLSAIYEVADSDPTEPL
uniref:Hypoxanthine phosphoribosyltransferase n=1 Tax=Desulfatirhabdium butyrativorans TaxID=340467 RepID=A0A7C4VS24_9BACT